MRFLVLFLTWCACASAQLIPGQYVVELQGSPMGALSRTRQPTAEARARRGVLDAEQKSARASILSRGGKVLGAMQNVLNAIAVEIPEENVAALRAMPGVKQVFPVSVAKPQLDHSLPLHQVPQAWAQLGGMGKAGLGIKIGVLDTGITPGHPAFQDPTLTPPPGYPLVSGPENMAVINNKIIVARNYASFYQLTKPDNAIDIMGHGTETADCAAGMAAAGPFATIAGVAPKAFLGIYKITPLDQGSASTAAIVAAIDDAYSDGMDVLNISYSGTAELYNSLWDYALQRVTQLGLVVAMSAGNGGDFPDTIGNGPDTDSVITVGASQNDREFGGSVSASGLAAIVASSGDYGMVSKPVTAPLSDLSKVDPTTLGCGKPFPDGSLKGVIAVTQTTPGCYYETILNNAAAAGAVGVILYPSSRTGVRGEFAPLSATLPAVYVSRQDGVALKAVADGTTLATVTFQGVAIPNESRALAGFSSRGPTNSINLKPDVTATGTFLYMATQSANPDGELYNASGYIQAQGTSFASPTVAGAVALLKQARPGLTMDQYRSLIINSATPLVSADGTLEAVQHTGAGVLNVKAALNSNVSVYPTSISSGLIAAGTVDNFELLNITNLGTKTDTFTVSAIPYDNAPAPGFSLDGTNVFLGSASKPVTVTLAPNRSQIVYVYWSAKGLAQGEYQGQLWIRGQQPGSNALVPYWYAFPDGIPEYLNTLSVPTQLTAGSQVGLYFKVKDSTGTAITSNSVLKVKTAVVKGDGKIQGPLVSGTYVNWVYVVATLSTTPGDNTFSYQVQGFSPITYTITGTKPPVTNVSTLELLSTTNPRAVEGGNREIQLRAIHEQ